MRGFSEPYLEKMAKVALYADSPARAAPILSEYANRNSLKPLGASYQQKLEFLANPN
jgi:hypothetical protein